MAEVNHARDAISALVRQVQKEFHARVEAVLSDAREYGKDIENAIGDVSIDEAYATWAAYVKEQVDEWK